MKNIRHRERSDTYEFTGGHLPRRQQADTERLTAGQAAARLGITYGLMCRLLEGQGVAPRVIRMDRPCVPLEMLERVAAKLRGIVR